MIAQEIGNSQEVALARKKASEIDGADFHQEEIVQVILATSAAQAGSAAVIIAGLEEDIDI